MEVLPINRCVSSCPMYLEAALAALHHHILKPSEDNHCERKAKLVAKKFAKLWLHDMYVRGRLDKLTQA
ncbi:hypothetical protein Q5P01_009372 [Channa striata]|uniref:Uncharacterized protein n=1 Tax=Channa striata TaxID=64152 RepID=A0AA88N5R7_CHASR|nr:hypothetical protein Q5P01_009372 [Channa striata]